MRTTLALRISLLSAAVAASACGKPGEPMTNSGTTGAGAAGGGGGGTGGDVGAPDAGSDGPVCSATTCAEVGADCGTIPDGCGASIVCGTCTLPETCGGAGTPNVCGEPCVSKTCADLGVECGPANDGCGKALDCGGCADPADTCGGGGTPGVCGHWTCAPKTAADCPLLGYDCGPVGDGCGSLIQCGTCTLPEICGGAGIPNVCGTPPCVPKTCVDLGADCGTLANGCGGTIQCGTCTLPEICGGAGLPNVCAVLPCVSKTCAELGIECGPAGDGCGNAIDCGGCPDPQDTCGGGGTPSVCGHVIVCVPKTAADCPSLGINCGPSGDGCGGSIDCGTCPSGQSCGGGGIAGVCGTPMCVPKTCAQVGASCGPVSDGCGGLLQCGTCSAPQICGGAGTPSVCGVPPTCSNLCLQQTTCSSPGVTTTISGTVYAPNGTDPLPNALVYVPNSTVQPFTPGVSCDNCGAAASGSPLVKAYSGVDGKFTIQNAPVGANIPLVIQIGRWRRQVTIPNVAACTNNAVAATSTRLPRNKSEGDIPLMAFSTGSVDALECVWRKIGIADAEFTAPTGNGRIHLYAGWGSGGATIGGSGSPVDTQLTGSATQINKYDMVLFPCQGNEFTQTSTALANIKSYLDAGGRVFATHYSYVWFFHNSPFDTTAAWQNINASLPDGVGYIDQTFPKGQLLAQWLMTVGASTTLGQIPVQVLRWDMTAVNTPPSQLWMTHQGVEPLHMTFNTPVGAPADQQCGRAVFSDFHVENHAQSPSISFPTECSAGAMTAQEKLLEFMLFDLASCVTADQPTCTPKTCADLGIGCGPSGDGCGNVIQCGACPSGQSCGGGGPSQCGTPSCTPRTCAQQGIDCGAAGDGCGNLIQCGACPAGETCGGGGTPGVCGASATCSPRTCAQLGIDCGPAGDGCGGLIQCGTCPSGQTCGGGGTPGVCGAPPCMPQTCVGLGAQCGVVADGCGNVLQCGSCPVGQTCGAGNHCVIG